MTAEKFEESKKIKPFLAEQIEQMSKDVLFFGHCKKHLMSTERELVKQALAPKNKFGVGSCFYFTERTELEKYLVSNMLQEPLLSEIAVWFVEGSKSCVFYINAPDCGIAFSKRNHDWSKGPLVCDKAVLLLERTESILFKIKTAYPLPEIF